MQMGMAITTVDTHTHMTTMLTSEVRERVGALFSVRMWRSVGDGDERVGDTTLGPG